MHKISNLEFAIAISLVWFHVLLIAWFPSFDFGSLFRVVKERLQKLKMEVRKLPRMRALWGCHGHLYTHDVLKMCSEGLPCLKVSGSIFPLFLPLSCFSCSLHPCGGRKWSCQACLTSGILIYMTSATLNVVNLSVSIGSMVNRESTQQKREALYLLGVGHYRSGDYSRSRHFVEKCLEVWFYICVIHGFSF